MHKKELSLQELLRQQLLPLYYHENRDTSLGVLLALYEAGIRAVEYTNRGGAALENFAAMKRLAEAEMPGLQLGIGTIKNEAQAVAYMEAGADFIVAPSMNEAVGRVVLERGLLWVPGCMTPTEIAAAENAGATLVKIFPGNILGPSFVSAVKDLFPGLKFMPTGGVEAEEVNLSAWFRSGVVAVGMGSKLISKEEMERGDFDSIREGAKAALHLIRQVTGEKVTLQ